MIGGTQGKGGGKQAGWKGGGPGGGGGERGPNRPGGRCEQGASKELWGEGRSPKAQG